MELGNAAEVPHQGLYPPAVNQKLGNALDTAGWAGRNYLAKGLIHTSFPEAVVQEAWATTLKATRSHSVAKNPAQRALPS